MIYQYAVTPPPPIDNAFVEDDCEQFTHPHPHVQWLNALNPTQLAHVISFCMGRLMTNFPSR